LEGSAEIERADPDSAQGITPDLLKCRKVCHGENRGRVDKESFSQIGAALCSFQDEENSEGEVTKVGAWSTVASGKSAGAIVGEVKRRLGGKCVQRFGRAVEFEEEVVFR